MHDLFIAVLGFYNGGTSNTVVVSESNYNILTILAGKSRNIFCPGIGHEGMDDVLRYRRDVLGTIG